MCEIFLARVYPPRRDLLNATAYTHFFLLERYNLAARLCTAVGGSVLGSREDISSGRYIPNNAHQDVLF